MHDLVSILLDLLDHPNLIGPTLVQIIEGQFRMRVIGVESQGELGLSIGDVEVRAVLEALVILHLH